MIDQDRLLRRLERDVSRTGHVSIVPPSIAKKKKHEKNAEN